MRPIASQEVSSVYLSDEDIRATIDVANLGVVIDTLTNLYSDPILAVMREYSTNALDSHVAAGQTRPIEVTLPTQFSPFFTVRDYGVGLNLDELRRTYLSYGASTKRESDAFNGVWGLGSKSGLTYAPNGFQVTAIKDGVEVLAVITKDVDGIPVMRILGTSETPEHNGVTIAIPVDEDDIHEFANRAGQFYRAWRPGTVVVDYGNVDAQEQAVGFEQPSGFHDDEDLIWLDDEVAIGRGQQSYIVMGSVPYRVDRKSAWGYGVVAYVEMGQVEFTPSREDLHYTDLTNDTLDELFAYVDARAEEHIVRYVVEEATPWQRIKTAKDLASALDNNRRRRMERFLLPHIPRDGVDLGRFGYRWDPERRNSVNTFGRVFYSQMREEQDLVIVGWPGAGRTLTPGQRDRLRRFREQVVTPTGSYYRPRQNFVLLPDVEVEMLEGRPNVYTWEQVVALTPPVKRVGGSRPKTQYTVHHAGEITAQEEVDPAVGPVLHCDASRYTPHHWSDRYPEAQIVPLRGNQKDRFLRLHPFAAAVHVYDRLQRKEAKERLTVEDKVRLTAGSDWQWLKDLGGEDGEDVGVVLLDPEFEQVRKAIAVPSPRVARARHLGVTNVDAPDTLARLRKRYPLLRHVIDETYLSSSRTDVIADLALYLNARWEQVKQEQEQGESDVSIDTDVDDDCAA